MITHDRNLKDNGFHVKKRIFRKIYIGFFGIFLAQHGLLKYSYNKEKEKKEEEEDRDATNSITVITERVWKYNK